MVLPSSGRCRHWLWSECANRPHPSGAKGQPENVAVSCLPNQLLAEPTSCRTSESGLMLRWISNATEEKQDRKITLTRLTPKPEALPTTHESATALPANRSENDASGTWKGNLDDSSVGTETG